MAEQGWPCHVGLELAHAMEYDLGGWWTHLSPDFGGDTAMGGHAPLPCWSCSPRTHHQAPLQLLWGFCLLSGEKEEHEISIGSLTSVSRIWWAGFDHLEIREKFFMVRVERSQNWLLREAVGAPALEVLKAVLDWALGNPS